MPNEEKLSQWFKLARDLLNAPEEEVGDATPECASCRLQLTAYLDAEFAGGDAASEFPEVARHLSSCEDCQEEYSELKGILQLDRQGLLPEPPLPTTLDYAFLAKLSAAPSSAGLWEHIQAGGQQVQRLVSEIRWQMGRISAAFEQLPPLLTPQSLPVAALRQSGGQSAQLLTIPSGEDDIVFELVLRPDTQEGASIGLNVIAGADQQPLARVRVTLRDRERRTLVSELTTESGGVHFPQISPGHYLIQVSYREHVWELLVALDANRPADL